jgi:P27 family predicted phage terminase small subunit
MPGNAGRKPIPDYLKLAKGTLRKERQKEVPEAAKSKPFPPSWLNKRAKQIFHRLTKRLEENGGRASSTYTEIHSLCASRLEEVERFDKALNDEGQNGYVYTTTNAFGDSILKENPMVSMREKAMRHVQSLLVEMGLTYIAATKVGTKKETKKKNEFEGF